MIRVDLDDMVALFDRRAGATHMLAEPAAIVLGVLDPHAATIATIAARLGLGDDAHAVLSERLDELVATELVERRPVDPDLVEQP